jgi:hypothetical protein
MSSARCSREPGRHAVTGANVVPALALAPALWLAAACYSPELAACAVLCGGDGSCPAGRTCDPSGLCLSRDGVAECLGRDASACVGPDCGARDASGCPPGGCVADGGSPRPVDAANGSDPPPPPIDARPPPPDACLADSCFGLCGTVDDGCGGEHFCGDCGCAHDECDAGVALDSDCSSCAAAVCDDDPFCCTTSWDSTCVLAVTPACGIPC